MWKVFTYVQDINIVYNYIEIDNTTGNGALKHYIVWNLSIAQDDKDNGIISVYWKLYNYSTSLYCIVW